MTEILLKDQSAEYVLFSTDIVVVPTGPDCARASASKAKHQGTRYLALGD